MGPELRGRGCASAPGASQLSSFLPSPAPLLPGLPSQPGVLGQALG